MNKTDKSKSHRDIKRNKTGNDATAGNSSTRPGKSRSFQGSKVSAVANESKRTANSQIRKGRKNAVT